MAQNGTRASGPRCIALVGPFQSGKTTLLEAILARTGAIQRQGTIEAGNTVGDASKEARDHKMSVELSVASTTFMGDSYTFIDFPGSIEFVHDMRVALPAVDAAVVVCELDEKKVPHLYNVIPGGRHDFKVWKSDLYHFSQLLFREQKQENTPEKKAEAPQEKKASDASTDESKLP